MAEWKLPPTEDPLGFDDIFEEMSAFLGDGGGPSDEQFKERIGLDIQDIVDHSQSNIGNYADTYKSFFENPEDLSGLMTIYTMGFLVGWIARGRTDPPVTP